MFTAFIQVCLFGEDDCCEKALYKEKLSTASYTHCWLIIFWFQNSSTSENIFNLVNKQYKEKK